jgi:gluconolactonase
VLHDFGDGRGVDGMTRTTEGLIVATAGHHERGPGPMIYVFEASGRVLSTHPTPADRPTNCTFAEAGRRVLYVTFGGGELYRATNTGLIGDL